MVWWVLMRKIASGMPPWLREDHLKSVSRKHCRRCVYETKKILKNGWQEWVTSVRYQPCISLAFVFIPGTHLTLWEPRMVIGSWNQPSGVSSVTLLNTLEVFLESQGRTQWLEKDKDARHNWPHAHRVTSSGLRRTLGVSYPFCREAQVRQM